MSAAPTGRLRSRLRLGRHQQPHRDAATFDLVQAAYAQIFVPRDGKSFCFIQKDEAAGDFHTRRNRCVLPGEMVAKILAPGVWVGHRARADVRYVAFDVDAGSRYLEPAQLDSLEAELDHLGLPVVRLRSSDSGGVHLYALLPEATHKETAHWLARAITNRLGWTLAPGQLEVFPSSSKYTLEANPKRFARCHGLRLPGQEGSALWAGGGWVEEPLAVWQELAAALEVSDETGASGAYVELCEEAQQLRQQHRSPSWFGRRVIRGGGGTIRHNIHWTGPGQSNGLLGRLANAGYMAGHTTVEALAQVVEELALAAPGFMEWASEDTRVGLTAWCRRWAECCIRKPPTTGGRRAASADPGRNERLAREARVAVIDGALRAAKAVGADALRWSERTAAAFLGMARGTFRKLKQLWVIRLSAAVYAAPKPVGPDPSQQGFRVAVASCRKRRLFSSKNTSLDSVSPATAYWDRKPPPPTSERRQAEFAELQAWLSAHVPVQNSERCATAAVSSNTLL